jgi:serine/threonine protein kinase
VSKAKNRIFEKTASARTKRMSYLSMEAINTFELKCAQTPDKKPLSRGTLKYKEFTACAKQKRKSFIDVNKELCSKVPLRVSSPAPVPAYMKPTNASKPKRMSFYQSKPEPENVSNTGRRKSFIEINVEKCCTSPKIEAMQRKLTRPPSPSAAYVTEKTSSRRLSIETNNSSRRSSLRSASAPSGSTRTVKFSGAIENDDVPSLCKVSHRPMFYVPSTSANFDSPKVGEHRSLAVSSALPLSDKANSISFESNYFVAQNFKGGELGISYLRHGNRLKSNEAITVKVIPKSGNLARLASIVRAEVIAEKAITVHGNIMKFYDFFDRPKEYYLVYESASGGDLFDYIATKQRFTEQDARSIVNDMLSALQHIHSKGIVHLDIRPENFLMTKKSFCGTVKLTGFTSSKSITDPVSDSYLFGAFEFMSLNRLRGANYDETDDIYSVGVLLHVLLCGYLPFFETGREAQHARLQRGSYDFDNSYCKGLSDLSRNFIKKLLSSNGRPIASAALSHAWFSEYPEKLLEFEWTTRNMKLFRRYNARRKILSIAREANFRKKSGRRSSVVSVAPKQSYMSGLFGEQRDSPPTTPAIVAVVEQMKERPLHPRESAMKPSQASPKPGRMMHLNT